MRARDLNLVGCLSFALLSPAMATPEPSIPDRIEFNRHVRPILSENCFACHGPDKNARKGGRRLDSSEGATAEQDGVRAIVPGDPGASDLVVRLFTSDPDSVMPPPDSHKSLTPRDRTILRKWVEQGGEYEPHWSYRPPLKTMPSDPRWASMPAIDAWVSAALDRRGWSPTPEAAPNVLLRRLHLDLTGLPPSGEELAAFEGRWKTDPERAWNEQVDRLLASPHFGERLAIQWLDLVRYADTVGYHGDQNMAVTPYRDYVIAAFNANKRFDEFTREQLAGDLLAEGLPEGPRRTELLVASGYNRLNSTSEEGGSQPKEYLVKYMTDRVRTTSTTWLAATLACSQCHDHKFDPLPMRDFYALGAFFADLEEVGVYGGNGHRPPEMMVPRPEDQDRLAAIVNTLLPAAEAAFANAQPEALSAEVDDWIAFLWESLPAVATAAGAPAPAGGIVSALAASPGDPRAALAPRFRAHAVSLAGRREAAANLRAEREAILARGTKTLISKHVDPRPIRILPRGNWMDDSGDLVEPDVPALFRPAAGTTPSPAARATRLDLARWLTSRENPLTARVFVNRLWKQFFGTGLSKTLDEMGSQGEWPIHPELLDWLAVDFMESGWDIKHLVRIVVTSRTYRQSSTLTPAQIAASQTYEADPENRWLGRQSRYRLDAELVRDNALAISGLLVRQIGGPSARPYQPPGYYANLNFPVREYEPHTDANQWRRGVYMHWQRTYLHPMLLAFDAPGRDECTANRDRSNTPLQALTLLNDPTFVEAARAFATRIVREAPPTPAARLDWAFATAVARPPTAEEAAVLLPLLDRSRSEFAADAARTTAFLKIGLVPAPADIPPEDLAAWTTVARAVLNMHATVTRQ